MGMQPSSVAAKLFRPAFGAGAVQDTIRRRVAASQTIEINHVLTITSGGLLTHAIVDTDLDNGEAVYQAAITTPLYIALEAITTGSSVDDEDVITVVEWTPLLKVETRCVAGGASGTPSAISSTGTDAATIDEGEAYALVLVKQNGKLWYGMGASQTNGSLRCREISKESINTADTYAIVRVSPV